LEPNHYRVPGLSPEGRREPFLTATTEPETERWATEPALDAVIGYFLGACPEAAGVVVAGRNGIPLASTIPRGERFHLVAVTAMAKLATWAGAAVAANLRLPEMSGVTIEGRDWKVILAPTPSRSAAVLVLMEKGDDPAQIQLALPGLLKEVDRTLENDAR